MYPMINDGVSIEIYRDRETGSLKYYITNPKGDSFRISRRQKDALMRADGTHPLELPDEGRKILPLLKKYRLVHTSRFARDEGIFNRFILILIGDRLKTGRRAFRVLNAAMAIMTIPVFLTGVIVMAKSNVETEYGINWWLYGTFLLCSIALHEIGHMIAGLSGGYKFSDAGIFLLGCFPIGAYVAHREQEDASKAQKIQFSLGGVETNLLIAGVCLFFAVRHETLHWTLVSVATINVLLAGINLLPAPGLDGESALSALLEIESISNTSKRILFSKKRRRKLIHSGLSGYICLGVLIFILFIRYAVWLFVLSDVAAIIYLIIKWL